MRPLVSTVVLLTAFPLLLLLVFERSERATRAWLDRGIDSEVETLEQVLGGEIHDTRIGPIYWRPHAVRLMIIG